MSKKKLLIGATAAVLSAALIGGGIYAAVNAGGSAVKVAPVSSMNSGGYWEESEISSWGYVTTSMNQDIYYSDSMKITEIFVSEGDTVKLGDPILSYDTSLMTLELEMKKLELESMKTNLENYQKILSALRKKVASSGERGVLSAMGGVLVAANGDLRLLTAEESGESEESSGQETQESSQEMPSESESEPKEILKGKVYSLLDETSEPYLTNEEEEEPDKFTELHYYVVPDEEKGTISISKAFLKKCFEYRYVLVLDTVNDAKEPTEVISSMTMDFAAISLIAQELFKHQEEESEAPIESDPGEETDPDPGEGEIDVPIVVPDPGPTKEEIRKEIKETEKTVKELELRIRQADVELQKLEKSVGDGTVKSTLNGTVRAVRDEETARLEGSPLISVVGDDGFYVTGSVAETSLDAVAPGMELSIYSWEDGSQYTAEITQVKDSPAENQYYGGNPNMSWYPFVAVISGDANLSNGSGVEMSLNGQVGVTAPGEIYLSQAFVREEGSRYYVMKKGENGRLTKQYVSTGRIIYGTIQIKDGLTDEDEIAFPYGAGVKEGAKTVSVDTLYDYYY